MLLEQRRKRWFSPRDANFLRIDGGYITASEGCVEDLRGDDGRRRKRQKKKDKSTNL